MLNNALIKAGCALKRPRVRILSLRVDAVSRAEALDVACQLLDTQKPHHLITANTLMALEAPHDEALRKALAAASFVFAESSGMFWAAKTLGYPLPTFIPGIDFMASLCGLAAERALPVFLLGSKPGVAEKAAVRLQKDFPGLRIAGVRDGYFKADEESSLLSAIRTSGARLVFVGLNMPRQETWIFKNLSAFGPALVMGIGGSLDVFSGALTRAPRWMRQLGIEWLYRLYQEPWRYGRILQLPRFVWHVLQEKRRKKSLVQ